MASDLLASSTPVARKYHRCDYCGETIHPGERYHNDRLVCDGEAYTWKSHTVCYYLAEVFLDAWGWGTLSMPEWWDAFWQLSDAELVTTLAGVFSLEHPTVRLLMQRREESRLPAAYGSRRCARTRAVSRKRWNDDYRGEVAHVL